MDLGRVKTQRRANCREKYSFESPLWERKEHTELRRRRFRTGSIGDLDLNRTHNELEVYETKNIPKSLCEAAVVSAEPIAECAKKGFYFSLGGNRKSDE